MCVINCIYLDDVCFPHAAFEVLLVFCCCFFVVVVVVFLLVFFGEVLLRIFTVIYVNMYILLDIAF